MTEVKSRPSIDDLMKSVNDYIQEFKSMDKEEAKKIAKETLIETGVLDENGKPKETIVTGDFFGW